MPKGGARSRSGPAPDPTSLKSTTNAADWTVLPPEGRTTPAPSWPLPDSDARELAVWSALWAKPQALEWERLGQEHYVALYVRRLVEAEVRDSPVQLSTLIRQMSDELGITAAGMNRNRWKIERPEDTAAKQAPRSSVRSRLTVVAGG